MASRGSNPADGLDNGEDDEVGDGLDNGEEDEYGGEDLKVLK